MKRSFHRRLGFTLIEMMMAITIFSIIMAAIYSTFTLIVHAKQVGERAAAESQRARIAIHTIEDSLISVQSFQASMKYYGFPSSAMPPRCLWISRGIAASMASTSGA